MLKTKTIDIETLRQFFRHDDDSGDLYWAVKKARATNLRIPIRSPDKDGYYRVKIDGSTFKVHRIVFALHYGFWPSGQIDHIDGCKTNNRIKNLRECAPHQNSSNRKTSNINTTGFKGVSRYRNKFKAHIRHRGVGTHLGYFNTAEEAHVAYCNAAKVLHKEFANEGCFSSQENLLP
jgi:hypothetical protein